jgi:hypothetical protein
LDELNKWIKPHAEAVDAYFGDADQDINKEGAKGLTGNYRRRRALGHAFLTEKGDLPVAPRKEKRFAWTNMPAMQQFKSKHDLSDYEWLDSPKYDHFKEAAHKAIDEYANEHAAKTRAGGIDWNEQDVAEMADALKSQFQRVPHSHVLSDVTAKEPDTHDPHTFGDLIEEKLKGYPDFEAWAEAKAKPLVGKRYLPKYVDTAEGPDERQLPYTPGNILREMTKQVRSGEEFNYGLGNARAKGAKQFSSMEEMAANRHRIVPKEDFEKLRDANNESFNKLADEFSRYHSAIPWMHWSTPLGRV